jgi:phage/plasmid-like protein (TIGR03299 family)
MHQIEDNMMAYRSSVTPWHGLGYEVSDAATGEEMLKIAGLDFPVELKPIYTSQLQGGIAVPGYSAVVRGDTDRVFQIAKSRYNPIQNLEVVNFFKEYCEAGHARIETLGGLRGGAIVWALARLNGGTTKILNGNDELRGYVLLATSHDGTVRTVAKSTQVCVVCWNTLSAALADESVTPEFRVKHSKKWTKAVRAKAQETIGIAIEQVQEMNELSEVFSKIEIDDRGRSQLIAHLLDQFEERELLTDSPINLEVPKITRVSKAIMDAINSSPGADLESRRNTLFGAVNGVTYHVDHQRGRSQDARLKQAWFPVGTDLKSEIITVAREFAGV